MQSRATKIKKRKAAINVGIKRKCKTQYMRVAKRHHHHPGMEQEFIQILKRFGENPDTFMNDSDIGFGDDDPAYDMSDPDVTFDDMSCYSSPSNPDDSWQSTSDEEETIVDQIQPLLDRLNKLEGVTNGYTTKCTQNGAIRLHCNSMEVYNKISTELDNDNTELHTHQLRRERGYRIVIRHLHSTTERKWIHDPRQEAHQPSVPIAMVHTLLAIRDVAHLSAVQNKLRAEQAQKKQQQEQQQQIGQQLGQQHDLQLDQQPPTDDCLSLAVRQNTHTIALMGEKMDAMLDIIKDMLSRLLPVTPQSE
ncbi:hypothetical protein ACLKA6_008520 [Drosophila palustris]